jgi:DNA-binding LacI/PurR family transcriptional regulator
MNQESSSPKITLRDIAKSVGVSHVTVSRALHDHPTVSLALRRQIQETARHLGYRPNPMARALGLQRQAQKKESTGATIAWINYWSEPGMLHSFRELRLYWEGAYQAAQRHGYELEEFVCHGRYSATRLEQILFARNIRGILIPPHRHEDFPPDWNEIQWKEFSLVRFAYSVAYPPVHVVSGNHVTSGIRAVENILRLGYKRIGLVTTEGLTTRDRGGYLMRQLDLPSEQRIPVLVLPSAPDYSVKIATVVEWMITYKPDCILTAIAALRGQLEAAGFRVPQDIGMATFSVLDGGTDAGIYQNSEWIGEAAIDTLCSLINQNAVGIPESPREVLIESRWVDGSSLPPLQKNPSTKPLSALPRS